jgi:patatin-like phospholipase/acyl hydrolase
MAEMLKEIEIRTGKEIYEIFDLICGTSTGFNLIFFNIEGGLLTFGLSAGLV